MRNDAYVATVVGDSGSTSTAIPTRLRGAVDQAGLIDQIMDRRNLLARRFAISRHAALSLSRI
jgi:hypothetical protein